MDGSSAWNISWCTGHDPCSSCSTRKTHMIVEPHDYIVPSQNLETGKVLLQVQMISRRCPLTSCGMCTKHWSGLGLDLSRVGLTLIVLQVLKSNMIETVWDWPSGTHAMVLFLALNYLGAESTGHGITTQASLRQEEFRYSSLWNTGMKRLLPFFQWHLSCTVQCWKYQPWYFFVRDWPSSLLYHLLEYWGHICIFFRKCRNYLLHRTAMYNTLNCLCSWDHKKVVVGSWILEKGCSIDQSLVSLTACRFELKSCAFCSKVYICLWWICRYLSIVHKLFA